MAYRRLTREEALAAKARVASGETQTQVAKDLDISQSAISAIVLGKTHANPVRVAMTKEEELARRRDQWYERKYGLSPSDWKLILETVGYACEVCGATDRRLVCDHDHNNGKVRGVLCDNCNVALGHLADSEERILKLLEYLRRGNQWYHQFVSDY